MGKTSHFFGSAEAEEPKRSGNKWWAKFFNLKFPPKRNMLDSSGRGTFWIKCHLSIYLQHALGIWWPKRTGRCLYFPVSVVSGSNMTLVLIENDIPLGGSRNKIEDNQVSSTVTKSNLHPIITLQYSVFLLGRDSQNTLSAWRREESWPITSASCAQVTA